MLVNHSKVYNKKKMNPEQIQKDLGALAEPSVKQDWNTNWPGYQTQCTNCGVIICDPSYYGKISDQSPHDLSGETGNQYTPGYCSGKNGGHYYAKRRYNAEAGSWGDNKEFPVRDIDVKGLSMNQLNTILSEYDTQRARTLNFMDTSFDKPLEEIESKPLSRYVVRVTVDNIYSCGKDGSGNYQDLFMENECNITTYLPNDMNGMNFSRVSVGKYLNPSRPQYHSTHMGPKNYLDIPIAGGSSGNLGEVFVNDGEVNHILIYNKSRAVFNHTLGDYNEGSVTEWERILQRIATDVLTEMITIGGELVGGPIVGGIAGTVVGDALGNLMTEWNLSRETNQMNFPAVEILSPGFCDWVCKNGNASEFKYDSTHEYKKITFTKHTCKDVKHSCVAINGGTKPHELITFDQSDGNYSTGKRSDITISIHVAGPFDTDSKKANTVNEPNSIEWFYKKIK
jgi:hypothetical protein